MFPIETNFTIKTINTKKILVAQTFYKAINNPEGRVEEFSLDVILGELIDKDYE